MKPAGSEASWTKKHLGARFFFSSRRRHTRLQGDWSSDVCSSDLTVGPPCMAAPPPAAASVLTEVGRLYDNTRATQQEHAGHAEALVDEWHRALRARDRKSVV